MECIDSDELKDNKIDKSFLEKRSETINETEFDSNNNMMGMDSDEKRKEITNKNNAEINKIIEQVLYETQHNI